MKLETKQDSLPPEHEIEILAEEIVNHAYLLEELKSRDYSKLLWYVRKHRAAKAKLNGK